MAILSDSALHLEELPHFAFNPDIGLFVDDGWPFTRVADLSETDVLLPRDPAPEEMATLLSVMSQLGTITGAIPYGARYLSDFEATGDRDLLVVGVMDRLPIPPREANRLPLRVSNEGLEPRSETMFGSLFDLLRFGTARETRARIRAELGRGAGSEVSAILGVPHPRHADRSLVAIVAASPQAMPGMVDLTGDAMNRRPGDDFLVRASVGSLGGERFAGRLGAPAGVGQITPWDRIRWLASENPMILALGMLLGAISTALWAALTLRRWTALRLGHSTGERR